MKVKSTKSALLMSFTSLLLCFAMLIGSTFAWFTDSVTSGVNQIKAGNLDIEVSYKNDTTSDWKPLQGSESVFSKGLWEPGHTEYVTLKIENKGNLALNYKMMVSPVTEKGGVNVAGKSFKLSDYLEFGITEASETDPAFAGRADARAAVTNTTKLSVNALTKGSTMAASAAAQYVTLVVYMPENVGNEANYKTGTAAPEINLGITVVATQLGSDEIAEKDSFGNDYDAGAVESNFNGVGPVYDYFPQVAASAPVATSGNTTITATGKLNSTDNTETELAKVTVPADAVASGVSELTVSVKPVDATNSEAQTIIQAEKNVGRETANFDIKVDGIKSGNTANITVEVFVGTGLNNVKAFHNGAVITDATYNSTTGKISFTTTSFSDYTISYDPAAAAIGSKTYGTLELAVAAAQDGETITLLKNCAGNGIKVPSGKNFTIDFNGFTYNIDGTTVGSSGTETNGFQLLQGSTITFKNGKLTSDKAKILIQNYCNLTLDNMTLDGTKLVGGGKYAASNNNGTVMIKNTTINAASDGVAFDVYSFGDYTGANVTVQDSVINGKVEVGAANNVNTSNLRLMIQSGTVNGVLDIQEAYLGKVTKGASAAVTAPDGYGWDTDGTLKELPEAKIGDTEYPKLANAFAAAKSGDTIEITKGGDYKLPSPISNLTIKSTVADVNDDKAVVFNTMAEYGNSTGLLTNVKFENVKFAFGSNLYTGFQHSEEVTFDDCAFTGLFYSYGTMTFNKCHFTAPESDYSMWLYAGDVNFNSCVFDSNGKLFNVYNEGNTSLERPWKIVAENCTFNSTKTNKAAFNVKDTCGSKGLSFDVTITNCTANGENWPAASTSESLVVISPLVQVDDIKASVESNIKVTLDGTVVYQNPKAN